MVSRNEGSTEIARTSSSVRKVETHPEGAVQQRRRNSSELFSCYKMNACTALARASFGAA